MKLTLEISVFPFDRNRNFRNPYVYFPLHFPRESTRPDISFWGNWDDLAAKVGARYSKYFTT
jgi:hypothetical protein